MGKHNVSESTETLSEMLTRIDRFVRVRTCHDTWQSVSKMLTDAVMRLKEHQNPTLADWIAILETQKKLGEQIAQLLPVPAKDRAPSQAGE